MHTANAAHNPPTPTTPPAPEAHPSGTQTITLGAVDIGDLVHSPIQFTEPGCEVCLSEDPPEAARARRRILEMAADTRALVLPAHLPGSGAAEIRRDGGAFAVEQWAAFDRAGG